MPAQDLVFESSASMPWIPVNVSGYQDWSGGNQEYGSFVFEGEKFGFVRVTSSKDYSHFLVGLLPEGNELEAFRSSEDAKRDVKDYISVRDRRAVHILKNSMEATFLYGTRYCKPCIVCSKELETVDFFNDTVMNQPHGGTNFKTYGHYGSTVFDPDGRESLSINVCDECLVLKAKEGVVVHTKESSRVVDESVRTDWVP